MKPETTEDSPLRSIRYFAALLPVSVLVVGCSISAAAQDVTFVVGDAVGRPGAEVSVKISLTVEGETAVAGIANELAVGAPLSLLSCRKNFELRQTESGFAFEPDSCGSITPCTAASALVISRSVDHPLPGDDYTYSCQVLIDANADAGDYAVECFNPDAADHSAMTLSAACINGSVHVVTCQGDCTVDGAMSVDEVVLGLNILLGREAIATCTPWDPDGDGVQINELVLGINALWEGCP